MYRYLRFVRENAPLLAGGILLAFLASFGRTTFVAIFGSEIRAEFGLSNGEWGGIYTLGTGVSALLMFWAGGLTDRFPTRQLAPFVIAFLAASCFALGSVSTVLLLPPTILGLRFFGQGMGSTLSIVTIARSFVAERGRALALLGLGFAAGEVFLPLSFVWMKQFVSWRHLWIVAGLVCLTSIPLLARLLRGERFQADDGSIGAGAGMDQHHWTRQEALRLPIFWVMTLSLVIFPAMNAAFWFHQVHLAEVKGWEHLLLVALFPLMSLSSVISTQAFGVAIDRWGATRLLPLFLIPFALGTAAIWYAPNLWWAALGLILMGITDGGQATIPPACWAELFGVRHIGSIKSVTVAMMVFGTAVGPGITGWLIDHVADFPTQMLASGFLLIFACLAMVAPVRAAHRRLR